MAHSYNKKITTSRVALRRIDQWFDDEHAGTECAGMLFRRLKEWIENEEHREAARRVTARKLIQIAHDYRSLIQSDYEGRNGISGEMGVAYDEAMTVIKEAQKLV